ncbi:MAG: tyrosine-protein phosphatase [Pseudomonadota bacterium]
MQHVFWLVTDVLCGRPGPNYQPWDPVQLHAGGIRGILSVNGGDSVYADELAAADIDHICLPLSPNAPPLAGDLDHCIAQLPRAYDWVCAQSGAVLVHCRHGKDRTGLFMAYYLMRQGHTPQQAIERVRAVRPIAFSAEGWLSFAASVLASAAQADHNGSQGGEAADGSERILEPR